jgi:hypothetical protein
VRAKVLAEDLDKKFPTLLAYSEASSKIEWWPQGSVTTRKNVGYLALARRFATPKPALARIEIARQRQARNIAHSRSGDTINVSNGLDKPSMFLEFPTGIRPGINVFDAAYAISSMFDIG